MRRAAQRKLRVRLHLGLQPIWCLVVSGGIDKKREIHRGVCIYICTCFKGVCVYIHTYHSG